LLNQLSDHHYLDTGLPLRKVITKPAIAGRWSDLKAQSKLSDKKLDSKGFTKYVKMSDGVYEKRAGQGPDVISAD
jgi:hypothetical protein